jgi:hypothetical protein
MRTLRDTLLAIKARGEGEVIEATEVRELAPGE